MGKDRELEAYLTVTAPSTLHPADAAVLNAHRDRGALVRRLVDSSICKDGDHAPHDLFILAPLLMILMMVFFMYRKPVRNYLSGKTSVSYKGLTRFIQKKTPVRH